LQLSSCKRYKDAFKTFCEAAAKHDLPQKTWKAFNVKVQQSQLLTHLREILEVDEDDISDDVVGFQHALLKKVFSLAFVFCMWQILGIARKLRHFASGKEAPMFSDPLSLLKEAKGVKSDLRDYYKRNNLKLYVPDEGATIRSSIQNQATLSIRWDKRVGWSLLLQATSDIPAGTVLFRSGGALVASNFCPVGTAENPFTSMQAGMPSPTNIGLRSRLDSGWARELQPIGSMPNDDNTHTVLDTYDMGGLSRLVLRVIVSIFNMAC
jgi:hypothetical protein